LTAFSFRTFKTDAHWANHRIEMSANQLQQLQKYGWKANKKR